MLGLARGVGIVGRWDLSRRIPMVDPMFYLEGIPFSVAVLKVWPVHITGRLPLSDGVNSPWDAGRIRKGLIL